MQLLASYTCINYQQQGRIQDFQRKGAPFDPPNGNYDMLLVSTEQTEVLDLSSVSVADRGGGHEGCARGIFMQFAGKIMPSNRLVLPPGRGVWRPPPGNPCTS